MIAIEEGGAVPCLPYVGPSAFDSPDEKRFFGRRVEIEQLVRLLVPQRIVLMFSPSGAGKTSLLRAGLIPRLASYGLHALPLIRLNHEPSDVPPGALPPNRYLYSTLSSLGIPVDTEESSRLGLAEHLGKRTRNAEITGEVLLFDQFEELFTLDLLDLDAKKDFMSDLGAALRDNRRWALFSIREDYIASLDPYLRYIPSTLSTTFRLNLLDRKSAKEAITKPAADCGVEFDETATTRLLDELCSVRVAGRDGVKEDVQGPYVEPLHLQVTCADLWTRVKDKKTVQLDDVAVGGNMERALGDYYEMVVGRVASVSGVSERAIRDWFDHNLITDRGIRTQVQEGAGDDAKKRDVSLRLLVDAHLVRSDARPNGTWYELAHDRMVEPVQTSNREWRDRNLVLFQRQAEVWGATGLGRDRVLRGADLIDAERWMNEQHIPLSEVEERFYEACKQVRDEERRRYRALWAVRFLVGLVIVTLLSAGWAGWLATRSARRANLQLRLSATRDLVAAAQANRYVDPNLQLLLAVSAVAQAPAGNDPAVVAARSTLYEAVYQSDPRPGRTFPNRGAETLAFSPDGTHLVTGNRDGTATLWNTTGPLGSRVLMHNDSQGVTDVAFSADGSLIAAAGGDGTAKVWSVNTTILVTTLAHANTKSGDEQTAVTSIAFRPGTNMVATGGSDGMVHVWDIPTQTRRLSLPRQSGPIRAIAFSPDGSRLATAGVDGAVNMWDLVGHQVLSLRGHSAAVNALAFSGDGRRLATASDDTTAKIWDTASGSEIRTLTGHAQAVKAVSFNSDGIRLATGSTDGTVRVWDSANGTLILTLSPHTGAVNDLAFNPRGGESELAVGTADGVPAIWNAAPADKSGHLASVLGVAVSPDGQRVATASADNTVKVWDISGKDLLTLVGHTRAVTAVAFSPDGTRIATASTDQTAILWNAADGKAIRTLHGHNDRVTSVAFDPTGTRVVTASFDRTARVWDASSGRERLQLGGAGAPIYSAVFSPDGSRIVTAGANRLAMVWDANTGGQLLAIDTTGQQATDANFSPDGTRIVTASAQQTTTIWDARSGEQALTLKLGDGAPVYRAAFSPDGSRVATGAADGTLKVSDLATGNVLLTLSGHSGPITGIAFSPDSKLLMTSANDRSPARLWDLSSGKEGLRFSGSTAPSLGPSAHLGGVRAVAFAPDGRLATASADSTAKLWDPFGRELFALVGHSGPVNAVSFSHDGARLATASDDKTVKVWDTKSGRLELSLAGNKGPVTAVAFSPDATRVVTGSEDGSARMYDAASGKQIFEIHGGAPIRTVAYSLDGKTVATGRDDWTLAVLNASTGQELRQLHGHTAPIRSVAFASDGTIISGGDDHTVKAWGSSQAKPIASIDVDSGVLGVAVRPGHREVTAATSGGLVALDLDAKTRVLKVSTTTGLISAAYNDIGTRLAVGDADGGVSVMPTNVGDVLTVARRLAARSLTPQECQVYLHNRTC